MAAVAPREGGDMDLMRCFKHLIAAPFQMPRSFSPAVLVAIESAVAAQEIRHRGEMRFVVETGLSPGRLLRGMTPRQRAIELFGELGVWDTEQNSGVLIYLLFADHAVEILADRGIQARAGNAAWEGICRQMQERFAAGDFSAGSLAGIQAIGEQLTLHFPASGGNPNELPDKPLVL